MIIRQKFFTKYPDFRKMKDAVFILFIYLLGNSVFAQTSFPFIEIHETSETIIKEIRYAGADNFLGKKVDGYLEPKCYLTSTAAKALSRVQEKLLASSYSLKVFDCYRPQKAVDHFVRWAQNEERDSTKYIYFPNILGEELFEQGYIAGRSGHSRGSTIDLTIVQLPDKAPTQFTYDCTDPEGYLLRGSELNMGTAFDCFDEKSHTSSPSISKEVLRNRMLLVKTMEEEGFVNYSKEWWHFTYKPEDYPDTYFSFPIE